MSSTQIELKDRPDDLISCVKFAPSGPVLLVTSWDGTLGIYDARKDSGQLYGSIKYSAPLLDAVWDSARGNSTAYTAGIEQRVYAVDVEYTRSMPIGTDHDGAVKGLAFHKSSGTVISGSWDKTLQQIDPRASPAQHPNVVMLPDKVLAMDAAAPNGNRLVVATGGQKIVVFDMRQLDKPMETRDSSLKYPVRTIGCMPWSGEPGYVSTSIEGRVAVDFFDSNQQDKRYAFKCHRIVDKSGPEDTVMPVTGLAFHPKTSTFFTGGSDGTVALWDYQAKKRLKSYSGYPAAVVALDVDAGSGTMLAVGVSEDGYRADPSLGSKPSKASIFIRYL